MTEKIRVSLDLTPAMKALIEELAEKEGVNQGEVLRRAIALFKVASGERRRGNDIIVMGRDGKIIHKLIWY